MYVCVLFNEAVYLTDGAIWLMLCATRRKVAGSVPDGVTGIFRWNNPSKRRSTTWSQGAKEYPT